MGFLSYSLRYYREELQRLENRPASPESLYHARRLLRMLDDLDDEGYTALNGALEQAFCGTSRLRDYLKRHHAAPFSRPPKRADAGALVYPEAETELRGAIARAMQAASAMPEAGPSSFADRLRRFCRWIGYDGRTAYVFLLRDTLLPFVYYSARDLKRVYPWLLGRSAFAALTGRQDADDELRASVYRALEAGCTDFSSFLRAAVPDMRRTMLRYPRAKDALCSMLADIDAERILVVESGCAGTFPLLLMSLDARVDMRMYTAYPYLTGVYGARVFTARYEENRLFETMASQELYFRFSGVRNGLFYVRQCADAQVERQALAEIRRMQQSAERRSVPDAPRRP